MEKEVMKAVRERTWGNSRNKNDFNKTGVRKEIAGKDRF